MPTESGINDSERRLFDIIGVDVRCMKLVDGDRDGDRHRDSSTTVEVV